IPDLASVVMHEIGHGIGFNHSFVDPAVMEGGLWGTYPGPYADDIAGVQAMYGARKPDAFDAQAPNDTLAAATPLTLYYGGVTLGADITTMSDVDYYKVTTPSGTDGTMTVSVDARNLSLFDPKVSVYDSSGTLLATASASTYGDVATVNLIGLIPGQTYYLRADGATTDAFGMGAYKLTAQFGGFAAPPVITADRFEINDTATTATNFGTLGSISQTGLTFHTSTDVDYYTFTAANRGTYVVSVVPTQGTGALGLTVLGPKQAVLASGQSTGGGVTLTVSLGAGQQVYVKAQSPTGSLFVYNLTAAPSGGSSATTRSGKKLELMDGFRADGREVEEFGPRVALPPGAETLSGASTSQRFLFAPHDADHRGQRSEFRGPRSADGPAAAQSFVFPAPSAVRGGAGSDDEPDEVLEDL